MKLKIAYLSLKPRLRLLPALLLAGGREMQATSFFLGMQINRKEVFPNFESPVLNMRKSVMESLVDAAAQIPAERVKPGKAHEGQIAIISEEANPIRYFIIIRNIISLGGLLKF
jgi:hypothetical protein